MLGSRLNDISQQMEDLRNIATTGKRLNKPSDDPSAIRPVFDTRRQISNVSRDLNTMGQSLDVMQATDGYLNDVENIMQRVKEITSNAANGSLNDQDRATLADEVGQLRKQLLDTANAQVNGKYLFAGYNVKTQPFVENPNYDATKYDANDSSTWPVLYKGDGNATSLEITSGHQVQVTLTGNNLFLGSSTWTPDPAPPAAPAVNKVDAGRYDIFAKLTQTEEALRNYKSNAPDKPSTASITGAQVVQGVTGVTAEEQGFDLRAVTVKNGDNFTFTIPGVNQTVTYSNTSGSDLSGANLATAIAAQLGANHAVGTAGNYSFAVDGTVNTQLNVTQSAGNESDIGNITTAVNGDPPPGSLQASQKALQTSLADLEGAADQNRRLRSQLGNRTSMVQTTMDDQQGVSDDLKQILSRYQDADAIEAINAITQQETAFQAALSVTGQVSKLSILNYI